jgi:phosphoesterase RecJ-like protein
MWTELGVDDLSGESVDAALRRLARDVAAAERVLIATHVSPDGDAIGSLVALALVLRRLGKNVLAALTETLPEKYEHFVPPGAIDVVDASTGDPRLADRDLAIVLDTSEPDRVGALRAAVLAPGVRRICLDHHLHHGENPWDSHMIVRRASAASVLVLGLIDALGAELRADEATLLWVGLASDTGWFRYSNTTPLTLMLAARLIRVGAFDPEAVFDRIYARHGLARTRLLGATLERLRTDPTGEFVWGVVRRADLSTYGVAPEELEGLIDGIRAVRGTRAAALITEVDEKEYKVSLRASGDVDVERVAREFGGGGHRKAAGCRLKGSLEDVEVRLVEGVQRSLSEH